MRTIPVWRSTALKLPYRVPVKVFSVTYSTHLRVLFETNLYMFTLNIKKYIDSQRLESLNARTPK